MEETLKLILEKISAIDEGQQEINKKISSLEQGQQDIKQDVSDMKQQISFLEKGQKEMKQSIKQRLDKIDMAIKHSLEPKISALFDERFTQFNNEQTIAKDLKEITEDICSLRKAVIRNTSNIVDLQDIIKNKQ